MKSIAIADLHGEDPRKVYDEVLHNYNAWDENCNIIFLGDYFSNRNINEDLQIKRFFDLLDIKEKDERVHLLVGNHDALYLDYKEDQKFDLRFSKDGCEKTNSMLLDNLYKLEYCFSDGKFLFSHTGITNKFLDLCSKGNPQYRNIDILNKMLVARMFEMFEYQDGLKYRYHHPEYSTWDALIKDQYCENQVVGHYKKMGPAYNNGIFNIDSYKTYGNTMCFES